MAINFPNSPTLNQIYTFNGLSWRWTGSSWTSLGTTIIGATGATGATGPVGDYVKSLNGLTTGVTLYGGTGINLTVSISGITIGSTSTSGSNAISSLTPPGITGDIIGYCGGSWNIIKPNRVSMPLPNFGSITSTIGGFTSWNVQYQIASNGFRGVTLGNGTFLVHNTQYTNIGGGGPGFDTADIVPALTTIIQGENLNFPKFGGVGVGSKYIQRDKDGNLVETSWDNGGTTVHVGWAIRLSGVTSGGFVGGAFGGGIQAN